MSVKKRKVIKIFIIIAVILAILTGILFAVKLIWENQNKIVLDYEFYVPAEDEDYFGDPEYLKKDRTLHYTDSMGQCWYIDENSSCDEIGAGFFSLYFLALEQGDADTLNSLYKEELAVFTDFTPQRVYQKQVVYLYDERIDDNTFSITYSLDYNIMKNDGSFRRDIGSDMSRTQYITMYYNTDGESWIENVKSEYRK